MKKLVAVNDRGRRIGQDHPRAVATDRDVDLVFELRDSGLTYQQIADKMELPKATVQHWLTGRRRCQHASRFKRVLTGGAVCVGRSAKPKVA